MYFIGYDIGSSSVKACLLSGETGESIASASYPREEMEILAKRPGWAEQDPLSWWQCVRHATQDILSGAAIPSSDVKAVGISYQMHGLVIVDKHKHPLRPSIIWCDSRAVDIGTKAFQELGEQRCLRHLLNSPGNFTASKLKWVKEHEPEVYRRAHKIMLPGDYIAMGLTGDTVTTISGLSEGILWDYKKKSPAYFLLEHLGIDGRMLPPIVPTFGEQGRVSQRAAEELGLATGTPVTYRAGDQPNNALSLNVLKPGEMAATAGTSGVVYAVSDAIRFDPACRVNTFAHVNYTQDSDRLGVLLCINGTGISNSWLKKTFRDPDLDYGEMNSMAQQVGIGSDGLRFLPFGNGAERMLENRNIGAQLHNLNFNMHSRAHLMRAVQEGVALAFKYGMDLMGDLGVRPKVIRAGCANMFLSPVFREVLAGVTGATIELYNTDGAQGAARGAAIGLGYYRSLDEAFHGLHRIRLIEPEEKLSQQHGDIYAGWLNCLNRALEAQRVRPES